MTRLWDPDDRGALLAALLPDPAHQAAYHDDPDFHAVIQGLTRSLPAVVDYALSRCQPPERTSARREEATRLLNQGLLSEPELRAAVAARTGRNSPCTCGSDTPFSMGPNHTDDCPMLFRRRHPGEPT